MDSQYEWFVVDNRTGQIVNCITTRSQYPPSLDGWIDPHYLSVTRRPSREQLEGYRFWNERP